jgi:HEAT repeat protein
MRDDFNARLRAIAARSPALEEQVRSGMEALAAARVESFEALCSVPGDPGAEPELRLIACWFLGQLGDRQATPLLLAALGDSDCTWEAAKALGIINDRRAVLPLLESLSSGAAAEVRAAAAYALGLLGDDRATPHLVTILSDRGASPLVRGHAAEALATLGGHQVVEPLIAALRDPSPEVRFWASFALGEKGDASALSELQRLADSDDAVLPRWGALSAAAQNAIRNIRAKGNQAH